MGLFSSFWRLYVLFMYLWCNYADEMHTFQRTFYLVVSNNQYFLFKSASSVARHIGCSRNRLPKMLAKGVYTHKKSNSVVFTLNLQK